MPYVNIKITREGATAEQKAELIRGSPSSCATSWERTPRRRWSSSTRSTPTAGDRRRVDHGPTTPWGLIAG